MNLQEAITYAREHDEALKESGTLIVGVTYSPNDSDGEFQIIQVTLNDEEDEPEYFDLIFSGGNVPDSGHGVEGYFGGENYESIINDDETPDFAQNLNYQLYQIDDCLDYEMPYALRLIFPELPNPDLLEYNDKTFKPKAIELITKLNESSHSVY